MKKITIRKPGGYDRLELETVPDLHPSDDEVVVQVKATGINYADIIIRWGLYDSAKKFVGWPITPGFEYAGIVKSAGKNVTKFKVGDSVVGCSLFNGYAEEVKITPDYLFPLPKNWSFSQAAGMPATYLTAYHALFQNVIIRPGAKVLVHSAAGGVGTALLQMGRLKGFEMVGVVGSPHKVEAAKKFGAHHVIDKSSEDWYAKAKQISPAGYDVVLDANGVSTLGKSWSLLCAGGKLMIYGFHSMFPTASGRVNYLKLAYDFIRTPIFHPLRIPENNRSLVFFNLSFLFDRVYLLDQAMGDMLEWIAQGKLLPPVVKEYPFADVAKAHEHLESGKSIGKLVLVP